MSEWKEYRLGDLCERVTSGGTPSTRKNEYYGGEIPWVRTQEVNFNRIYDTEIKITKQGLDNSSAKWIPENSVIIAMYGATAGKVAINKIPLTTNQACCNLIIDESKADHRFIYYNILSRFSSIANMAVGGAQQNLNAGMIKDLFISTPDLPTQTEIAEILSSLDDKIELNNKINQELENLAQTLFKQWFIDFEFPNENGEPYKSAGGEMVESELGEIPKGWEVNRLNDIADCFDKKRIPLSSMERNVRKGNYPYYGAASLMDYIDDYLFDGVYILMGEDGSVTDNTGYPVLQYVFGKFWVNNHAHVLKGRKISTEIVLCLLKNTNISDLVTGAVQPKLNQGNMNKISIPLPQDLLIISDLEKVIIDYYNLIRNNILEIEELVNIRDVLLPKLISGELEINELPN